MEMFLAALLGVVTADVPLLVNPGFEQLSQQTGLPQSWHLTFLPNQAHLVHYKPALDEGQESKALAITVAENHPDKNVAYNAMQDVPNFVPGKSYRVSAKVRTQGLSKAPFLCVQCLDASRQKFVGFAGTPNRPLNADIQEWERIETTVTVPEDTATFRVRVGISSAGNAGGTALIDDIEIVEIQ